MFMDLDKLFMILTVMSLVFSLIEFSKANPQLFMETVNKLVPFHILIMLLLLLPQLASNQQRINRLLILVLPKNTPLIHWLMKCSWRSEDRLRNLYRFMWRTAPEKLKKRIVQMNERKVFLGTKQQSNFDMASVPWWLGQRLLALKNFDTWMH